MQLATYVSHRTEENGERYVGVLTDGRRWLLHRLGPDGELVEIENFTLQGGDLSQLCAWIEPILATRVSVKPTPADPRT